MASPLDPVAQLGSALERSQAGLKEVAGSSLSAPYADGLNQMIEQLKSSRAQLLTEYGQDLSRGQEAAQKTADALAEQQAALTSVGTALDSAGVAAGLPPAPVEKPEPPVDPDLGERLRSELLGRFGNLPPPKRRSESHLDIQDDWSKWDT